MNFQIVFQLISNEIIIFESSTKLLLTDTTHSNLLQQFTTVKLSDLSENHILHLVICKQLAKNLIKVSFRFVKFRRMFFVTKQRKFDSSFVLNISHVSK